MNSEILTQAETQIDKTATTVPAMVEQAMKAAQEVKFPNKQSYADADKVLVEINRIAKVIDEKRMELTRPLDQVKSQIKAAADARLEPLLNVKELLRSSMKHYAVDEQEWAAEEQKKRDAEAKKKAEDERLRLAANLEKNGQHQEANDLIDKPVVAVAPTVMTAQAAASSSVSKRWRAELLDKRELVKAWLEGKVPETVVTVNLSPIEAMARAQQSEIPIPGVRVFQDVEIRAGHR